MFEKSVGSKKAHQCKLRICSTQHRESVSKAYPSNLTRAQYELLSEMIPKAKPGGRPREVDMWEILNAIFYVLVEGVRWRSLPIFGLANGIHLLSHLAQRRNLVAA